MTSPITSTRALSTWSHGKLFIAFPLSVLEDSSPSDCSRDTANNNIVFQSHIPDRHNDPGAACVCESGCAVDLDPHRRQSLWKDYPRPDPVTGQSAVGHFPN